APGPADVLQDVGHRLGQDHVRRGGREEPLPSAGAAAGGADRPARGPGARGEALTAGPAAEPRTRPPAVSATTDRGPSTRRRRTRVPSNTCAPRSATRRRSPRARRAG